jgi:hypothetical protein
MSFVDTRETLHRLAANVVSPARVRATGNEIALTPTPGGFGTPPFPDVAFDDHEVTYGGSPGDEQHAEPYLYVAPWMPPPPGPLWNATGFTGAEAPYDGDAAAALAFLRERRDACRPSAGS